MRVLCVCESGVVRSGALSYLLRYCFGVQALTMSWATHDMETHHFLCEWADKIVVVREEFRQKIHPFYQDKVVVIELGHDVWFNPLHPELLPLAFQKLEEGLHLKANRECPVFQPLNLTWK